MHTPRVLCILEYGYYSSMHTRVRARRTDTVCVEDILSVTHSGFPYLSSLSFHITCFIRFALLLLLLLLARILIYIYTSSRSVVYK